MESIEKIFEDSRYNMACTYIVNCMGVTEVYTRDTKEKLFRDWGKEEARVHFLNTRELIIDVQ